MSARVPESRMFGRQNSARETTEQKLEDALRLDGSQYAELFTRVQTLQETVEDLSSRLTVAATISTFNTGPLPNDATFHEYGDDIAVEVTVPEGKQLVITVGCGEATIDADVGAVTAEATVKISGGELEYGGINSRAYVNTPDLFGVPLMTTRPRQVPPGTYTVTGKMRAWASGTSAGSVNFSQPYLTVQVTGGAS